MKKAILATTAVVGALALAGCGANVGSEETESITFSTSTQFPPMAYIDADKLVGFEIDFGEELAERAGYEVEWNKSKFSQFISDVNSGRSDAVLGAMIDMPERQENFKWMDYLQTGFQFYTTTEMAAEHSIEEPADLCGLTVAASRNSSYKSAIDAWSAESCNGNDIEVLDTDGSPDALLQLRQGRAQAAMQTSETITYNTGQDDTLQSIGAPITADYYGLGLHEDDTEILQRLQDAFQEMIDDGSYVEIAERWNLGDQVVDRITVNLLGRDDARSAK